MHAGDTEVVMVGISKCGWTRLQALTDVFILGGIVFISCSLNHPLSRAPNMPAVLGALGILLIRLWVIEFSVREGR